MDVQLKGLLEFAFTNQGFFAPSFSELVMTAVEDGYVICDGPSLLYPHYVLTVYGEDAFVRASV